MKTDIGEILCLVDVKKYREDRKIGVGMVRTLYGTLADYQASSAMLVTTSSYSKDARAMQEMHKYQLSLKDYADVASWIQKYGKRDPTARISGGFKTTLQFRSFAAGRPALPCGAKLLVFS